MSYNFPEIIFEDKDYLVINKPAGLIVHRTAHIQETTLADLLISYYPKIKTVGEDQERPGIVHRLDKEVSGLMVIAKNNASFQSLKKQFQDRDVNKHYLALVFGKVSKETDTIDFPIKRSRSGYKMAALPKGGEELLSRRHPKNRDQGNIDGLFKSRQAITEFKILKRFVNYTLLDVKIHTGRTHQIRVHFLAYGHPLVGDNLYYTKKTKLKNQKLQLNRVFLVANQLTFRDLQGKRRTFSLDLPDELKTFLPRF